MHCVCRFFVKKLDVRLRREGGIAEWPPKYATDEDSVIADQFRKYR